MTGMLIVAPLVLTLGNQRRFPQARCIPEIAALFGVAVLVCLMMIDSRVGPGIENDVLAFAVLPVVLWAAIRFEIPGAAGVTLLISGWAVWETGGGFGPFVRNIAGASYPAVETGGDYFDFIAAPDDVLYVAIGDVSGHGFDAALIMALTRAYMRSFAGLGMDVGEVLRRANRAIVSDVEENRYVTMLLVRLDAHGGRTTYASAGHLPGVLLRGARRSPLGSTKPRAPLVLRSRSTTTLGR